MLANYKVSNRQAEMIFQILAKIVHLLKKKKKRKKFYFKKHYLITTGKNKVLLFM